MKKNCGARGRDFSLSPLRRVDCVDSVLNVARDQRYVRETRAWVPSSDTHTSHTHVPKRTWGNFSRASLAPAPTARRARRARKRRSRRRGSWRCRRLARAASARRTSRGARRRRRNSPVDRVGPALNDSIDLEFRLELLRVVIRGCREEDDRELIRTRTVRSSFQNTIHIRIGLETTEV